jgi:hypothetical protein
MPRHGINGTKGVKKYFFPAYHWVVLPDALPNDVAGGHCLDIFVAINTDTGPRRQPIIQPSGSFTCDTARHVKNENKLNHARCFCNRFGSASGDLRLIMIREQLVTVNAISIPALTKSSR